MSRAQYWTDPFGRSDVAYVFGALDVAEVGCCASATG
jgi:hypothetical protein